MLHLFATTYSWSQKKKYLENGQIKVSLCFKYLSKYEALIVPTPQLRTWYPYEKSPLN